MNTRLLSAMIVVSSLVWNAAANANVPNPALSTVDPCLVVCPAGDIPFHVTVRDVANVPIQGSTIMISFCSCVGHGFELCPGVSCSVSAVTDAAGKATLFIAAGGGCSSPVNVLADGVILASRTIASPDQNGDLFVDAADAAIVGGKIGTTDPSADLDCDGSVTPNDQTFRAQHAQHACGVVPTQVESWGRVKSIYR